jgi:hypothetical protein
MRYLCRCSTKEGSASQLIPKDRTKKAGLFSLVSIGPKHEDKA